VYLQHVCAEALKMAYMSAAWSNDVNSISLVAEFQALFSSTLGTANCAQYEIELSYPTRVCSSPHRCAPSKLKIFREMIDDMLEQGVVRPSKCPHANPAFWVPKIAAVFPLWWTIGR
jgi:hypothetical protein